MVGFAAGGGTSVGELRDFDEVRREAMRAVMGRVVVLRLFVAPVLILVMGVAVWLDPVPWRVALGTLVFVALVALSGVEAWRWERGLSGPASLPANLVVTLWIQLAVVMVAGGLEGPLFPVLPVAALQVSMLLGPGRALAAVVGPQIVSLWVVAALNATGTSLAVSEHLVTPGALWPLLLSATVTLMIAAAATFGSQVRAAISHLVDGSLRAHDSERVAHAEHARELVALTGEIAHELKNPLASIKGLATLLARDDAVKGKAAERLGVLRAEVDRMHETLDQFLDFSRPLVPLTQQAVDFGQLATEVGALCDGLARANGVTLSVLPGFDVVKVADRRKLRQVLVNLVHNAIEASPRGATIGITVGRDEASAVVRVEDRGAGLSDAVAAVAFEPGVTTRASGSGLGLTIARALVQQHGGTLTLSARPGGGTVATVCLP